MNKHLVNSLYVLNIVGQAIFTLLINLGVMLLLAWLFVEKLGGPGWLYVPFIACGALFGIYRMVRTTILACEALERLEEQKKKNEE